MYILYLDESGTHDESGHFVVAGIAVFERQTYFLAQGMERLQQEFFPHRNAPINFHASELGAPDRHVKSPFNELTAERRIELIRRVYQNIAEGNDRDWWRLFAVSIEKSGTQTNRERYEQGFEEIVNRFDLMLRRFYAQGNQQRGLIVIAESSYREHLTSLARQIAEQGHRWGETRNLADIPYFAPAENTRLLQLADFVSNAVYRRYEYHDARGFDAIMPCFDQDAGRIHGLVHITGDPRRCYCPACLSRRA